MVGLEMAGTTVVPAREGAAPTTDPRGIDRACPDLSSSRTDRAGARKPVAEFPGPRRRGRARDAAMRGRGGRSEGADSTRAGPVPAASRRDRGFSAGKEREEGDGRGSGPGPGEGAHPRPDNAVPQHGVPLRAEGPALGACLAILVAG